MTETAVAIEPSTFDPVQTGFFRFRRLGDKYLITNDFGRFRFLSGEEFRKFVAGTLDKSAPLYGRLAKDGFIRDHLDFEGLAAVWRYRNRFLWQGPSLHAVALTRPGRAAMSLKTAAAVVDRIFATPSPSIVIELQGEPLANWPAVKFIIESARKKNVEAGKDLRLTLVGDLSLLNDEKLKVLLANLVDIRAVLDGPADLHDKNRRVLGGGGHAKTVRWLRAIGEKTKKKSCGVAAEATVTRHSLSRHEEIVDEYARLGARGIFLRNMAPLDLARPALGRIACSVEEFLEFYRKAFDYILEINKRKTFSEETARVFLTKILTDGGADSASLRSPGGEGLAQLAYDCDGAIYASDEGLRLSRAGDDSFRLGSAAVGTYADTASHPSIKALAVASCLDNQPDCSRCAYLPFHGVSPLQNYIEQGDIMGRMPTNTRCAVHKGILDYLFEKLQDEGNETIFRKWLRQKETGCSYPRL